MKQFLAISILLFSLVGCSHNDDPYEDPIAERSVLVYVSGENNLTLFATDDINEMKKGSRSLNDRQNLIVYVDQADTIPPFFARIKDGQYVDSVSVKESITADPAVLEEALRYMRTNYPARSYGLLLWGHASGWLIHKDSVDYAKSRAYGGDTGNGSSGGAGKYWMNIPSMARAVANGMGGTPLKFVMGDCCSFGCVEVAYELRKVTEYMIGSPAEVPDEGAPFDLIIPKLFSQSEDFYKGVIDQYYNFYLDAFNNQPNHYWNITRGDLQGYSVPLVAVRSSELENLATATDELLSTIYDRLTPTGDMDYSDRIFYAMNGSHKYSYDMLNVLKTNTSTAAFNTWETAFWKAIVYRKTSNRWLSAYRALGNDMLSFDAPESDCGVLSMFFPMNVYQSTSPNWNLSIHKLQWNNVIQWQQYDW